MTALDWTGIRERVRAVFSEHPSVTQASKAANVDQPTMSKFLADGSTKVLSVETLNRLADFADKPIGWLLFGEEQPFEGLINDAFRKLSVDDIEPSPDNPRKHFDDDEMCDLAASIEEHGVLEPVLVRPHPERDEKFILIAGERRWLACDMLRDDGLEISIPAIVRDIDAKTALEAAIVENLQRSDVTIYEEIEALWTLHTIHGESPSTISKKTSMGLRNVQQRLQIRQDCIPDVLQGLQAEGINFTQARLFAKKPAHFQKKVVDGCWAGIAGYVTEADLEKRFAELVDEENEGREQALPLEEEQPETHDAEADLDDRVMVFEAGPGDAEEATAEASLEENGVREDVPEAPEGLPAETAGTSETARTETPKSVPYAKFLEAMRQTDEWRGRYNALNEASGILQEEMMHQRMRISDQHDVLASFVKAYDALRSGEDDKAAMLALDTARMDADALLHPVEANQEVTEEAQDAA